jgi:hypothetical protein
MSGAACVDSWLAAMNEIDILSEREYWAPLRISGRKPGAMAIRVYIPPFFHQGQPNSATPRHVVRQHGTRSTAACALAIMSLNRKASLTAIVTHGTQVHRTLSYMIHPKEQSPKPFAALQKMLTQHATGQQKVQKLMGCGLMCWLQIRSQESSQRIRYCFVAFR